MMPTNLQKLQISNQTVPLLIPLPATRLKNYFLKAGLLFFFLLFLLHKSYGQGVPELMYFRFDTPGPTVTNEAAPATRVSASGSLVASTIGSTGQFGTALQGNGSTSNLFDAGWATNLSGAWTMSMWFSGVTNSLSSNYLFGASGTTTFRAMTGSGLVSGAGNLLIRGTGVTDIPVNGIFDATGTPVVVTIVYDPAIPGTRVYVNGVFTNTVTQTATMTITGTNFIIGNYNASTSLPTGGKMDEFRLYNRALTATEITSTWNQPLPLVTTCSGTPTAPVITTAPQPKPICNTTVSLTATNPNTNASNLVLQWEQAPAATGPWTNAVGGSGATTLNYTTPQLTTSLWYRFKLTCPTSSQSATSAAYAITAAPLPLDTITGSRTFCPGATQVYSVPAVPGVTTYTWSLPTGWTGATNTNSITAVASATAGTISVTATGPCGTSAAQTATIVPGVAPAQPATITGNSVACTGAIQPYSIAAVPLATSYLWTLPSGWTGTSTTPSISVTPGAAAGNITVTAVNLCGSSPVQTLPVTATNQPAPAGVVSGSAGVCAGASETYTVAPIPSALSYTWTLPGGWTGTSATNSITLTTGTAGGNIIVRGNNGCGVGINATYPVAILPVLAPSVTIASNDTTICLGVPVTFTPTPINGGAVPDYQWLVNGIPMGTGPTFTTSTLTNGNSVAVRLNTNYKCPTVPGAYSNAIIMIVSPPVTPGINVNMNAPTNLCAGTNVTFTANVFAAGNAPIYQWKHNGTNAGPSAPTYTTTLNHGDSVYCILTSNAECAVSGPVNSNKLGVRVTQNVVPSVSAVATPGTNISAGQYVTFTASGQNGGSVPEYQWFKNGAEIVGATGTTYTTNTLGNGDHIKVRLISSHLCASPAIVTSNDLAIRIATGVKNMGLDIDGLALSPNPNNGRFTLTGKWTANMIGKEATIAVLNILGQTVYSGKAAITAGDWKNDISLSDQANGIYMLQITADNQKAIRRFEISK